MTEEEQALAEHGAALAEAIVAALPGWSARSVARFRPDLASEGELAGREAAGELGPRLRALLAADVDEQRANPLAVARAAVAWPTAVLREAGESPVHRDEHQRTHFPDDDYDLTPMTFAELDPSLQEPGILWGAIKARTHLLRHKR
ncbi:MAG: hypothetical protein JWN67_4060 [Actinomycetia bacterium]|nr:hypothetical protein [Actinomycetes bacterium]